MTDTINVFIPAAGLGERLKPITDHIPKPLLPLLGRPVLHYVLEKFSELPIERICVNLHHKREDIRGWLESSLFSDKVILFYEDPILGTGGGLKNAESILKKGTFIVHNSDIVSDIDLKGLLEYHLSTENLVTLCVHDCPEYNKLLIDEEGVLRGISNSDKYLKGVMVSEDGSDSISLTLPEIPEKLSTRAFTGIAVYEPDFLRFLPGGPSSVVDGWLKAAEYGLRIGTLDVSGCCWNDIGTPLSYARTVFNLMRADGENIYIDSSVEGCREVIMEGYVVVEKEGILAEGATLKNCIVLQGGRIEKVTRYENCILAHGLRIDLPVSESSLQTDNGLPLAGSGGSDRRYYRLKKGEDTFILMESAPDDPDFQRHIELTLFFRRHHIPVPELFNHDPERMTAVFEDLGDISLYSWLKCPRNSKEIREMYQKVIDILILIHTVAAAGISECRFIRERVFDYEHFRWESAYFMERFVKDLRKRDIKPSNALEDDLHRLAMKADSFPKTLIHRDFQSQNIMITDGVTPRLIDYQGARLGPPGYDLASILWDPYYRLEEGIREYLLDYYTRNVERVAVGRFDLKELNDSLLPCRLQRHMQALGAYGFLSSVKGKKHFLKYTTEGLRLLREDISLAGREYPALHNLIMELNWSDSS
jgi:NDP-sugar pyrophosphorylase family protein